jgi:hypothetical protein
MSAQHPGYLSAPNYNIGGCNGAIAVAPDVRLRYVAGQSPLFISVVGGTFAGGLRRDLPVHTTLVIRGPDGHWYCDEAALEVNGNFINPAIVFHNPVSGNYEIWIGIKFPGPDTPDLPDVDLYISEAYAVTG